MKPSDDRGFTLIEVLVAMVILTITLVSMAELMAITLRMQMLGRNQTSATRLAQDKIDELMSQNFVGVAALANGGSLTADVANHFDTPTFTVGNGNVPFKRRWVVANGPVDPGMVAGELKLLTVRVIPDTTDARTSTAAEITTIIRCWPCP